ncbi:MAG: glutamine synthetase III [Chlamydiia bacterium]|nr:glutamine synthetase III [Chlamydiia bacterium]
MKGRFHALAEVDKRSKVYPVSQENPHSTHFAEDVFNLSTMEKVLPKEAYHNVLKAIGGKGKITPKNAEVIAVALKEWAMNKGATHFSHWFQPLTGLYAEKHDAFIDWDDHDRVIEKFSGKQLVQGEPDASSFPSGGLRSTWEARGYTGWDPASPPFIWKAGGGITLCIPSVFFSWTGQVLDTKIPLLRSDEKINHTLQRLLKLFKIPAEHVYSTLGLEQEYFVIDRALKDLRPDLSLAGRTVFGAPSPKGQELQDHYFGAVKTRVMNFMSAFETEAIKLGIPIKTRHNEVAPAQHEVAPVFERASRAIDHNILLMEVMRKVAAEKHLACLLHEKPFQGINGSGKHMNWSLSTDTGLNLLDPTDTPGSHLPFLLILTAILDGVHRHAALLRASIASLSNDCRLGGHEAPPAIISVYLGHELEELLESIEKSGLNAAKSSKGSYDLKLIHLPNLSKDTTDRNRTSPFAFTGNKFEFRALGSSASPAFSATVLNLALSESLSEMLDQIEKGLKGKKSLVEAVLPVLQSILKRSKAIRFAGDNYSQAWVKEAKKRGIPNIAKSIDAFEAMDEPSTQKLFNDVLTKEELNARFEVMEDTYSQSFNIEVNLMLDLFHTQILPACVRFQKTLAESVEACLNSGLKKAGVKHQIKRLEEVASLIEQGLEKAEELLNLRDKAMTLSGIKRGRMFSTKVMDKADDLRAVVDTLETLVDDDLWPLPKYRELLFSL